VDLSDTEHLEPAHVSETEHLEPALH